MRADLVFRQLPHLDPGALGGQPDALAAFPFARVPALQRPGAAHVADLKAHIEVRRLCAAHLNLMGAAGQHLGHHRPAKLL